mmetsp:Transcript_23681/g.65735  ORF Transcript_23681/g.65735 Transcript_23681/m.65735 type:complete len:357 (-) Transcript_23681:315-1385(-)
MALIHYRVGQYQSVSAIFAVVIVRSDRKRVTNPTIRWGREISQNKERGPSRRLLTAVEARLLEPAFVDLVVRGIRLVVRQEAWGEYHDRGLVNVGTRHHPLEVIERVQGGPGGIEVSIEVRRLYNQQQTLRRVHGNTLETAVFSRSLFSCVEVAGYAIGNGLDDHVAKCIPLALFAPVALQDLHFLACHQGFLDRIETEDNRSRRTGRAILFGFVLAPGCIARQLGGQDQGKNPLCPLLRNAPRKQKFRTVDLDSDATILPGTPQGSIVVEALGSYVADNRGIQFLLLVQGSGDCVKYLVDDLDGRERALPRGIFVHHTPFFAIVVSKDAIGDGSRHKTVLSISGGRTGVALEAVY